jgi:hypothetical protein
MSGGVVGGNGGNGETAVTTGQAKETRRQCFEVDGKIAQMEAGVQQMIWWCSANDLCVAARRPVHPEECDKV